MTTSEIIKQLMYETRTTQIALAKALGLKTQSSANKRIKTDNPTIGSLNEMLELMGYEIVVQPKKSGRRADGQILVTTGDKK